MSWSEERRQQSEALQDAIQMRDAYARKIAEDVARGTAPDEFYVREYIAERDRVHALREVTR